MLNKRVAEWKLLLHDKGLEDPSRWHEWDIPQTFGDLRDVLFDLVQDIFERLSALADGDADPFIKTIRFGESGLGPLIKLLDEIHVAVQTVWGYHSPLVDYSKLVIMMEVLNTLGDPLHQIVLEYRHRLPRHFLDPPGFAELHKAVRVGVGMFEVSYLIF